MVSNALRGYLQLANGLTEVTKQRATDAARSLSAQFGIQGEDAIAGAGAAAGIATQQVTALAEELFASARANRRLLTELVRAEVERGVTHLGLAEEHQVAALRRAVSRLEEQVAGLLGHRSTKAPTKKAAAKKPAAKAADKSKTTAGSARPLRTAAPAAATAPKSAKKAVAKKSATRKVAVAKTAAKKRPAKKASAKTATTGPAS